MPQERPLNGWGNRPRGPATTDRASPEADLKIGIEHEFKVYSNGAQVDFRPMIRRLPVPGRRLDPGDRFAHRLETGTVITCDDREAEVSTPPLPVHPGCARPIAGWVALASSQLVHLVPGFDLEGVSTHISVSIADGSGLVAAGLFARTFAPAVMMLMERSDSEGLLIRPRYGRLELGGDYVTGNTLLATTLLAAGGTRLCQRVAAGELPKAALPPPVRVEVESATERYGWYVDRRAFGLDLYSEGRTAVLSRELGGSISGQAVLEQSWKASRWCLGDLLGSADIEIVDQFVDGSAPLPMDTTLTRDPMIDGPRVPSHPLGEVLRPIDRPGFEIRVHATTWDHTVFRLVGNGTRFVSVSTAELGAFLDEVNDGGFDADDRFLGDPPDESVVLRDFHQAVRFGVFASVGKRVALAPPERDSRGRLHLAC